MKRKGIKYLWILALLPLIKLLLVPVTVATIGVSLSSCCDTCDDTTTVIKTKYPTLTINPPQSTAFEVAKGEVVNFHITAKSSANTNKDLAKIYFKATYISTSTSWNTTWTPKSTELQTFSKDFAYTVPTSVSSTEVITILIQATDVDNQTGSKTFTLSVKDLSGLNSYTDIVLGAQNNADVGSFYATSINKIYKVADAKASGQTYVDFVYFYNNTYTATIASPDNSDVFGTEAGKIADLQVHTWNTKNATRFKNITNTISETDWETLTKDKATQRYTAASTSELKLAPYLTDASGGQIPSYYAFKTGQGKYGIFRVTAISDYSSYGTITIDVKVAK